ncbi:hypothetical protein DDB_G0290933 [Dictyostelium discoideum AX4]|uniref:TRAF-type domain-containing protein n=1 Tax=Dictyostelium discoideum TaxID=44689 RepID=Q54FD4_DICDI|nr:hypothetical protein DDB_G0290933 [Dictyostelium discoideum AX4]EAL61982.1 hypothetical protein DDB_G0290933 [Dictyostelium discoideum AX4]|eukprot:XP_635488.1 hypothetical protein DDB_G0290933 [Dictyostelium discoideum AX4]
MSLKNKQECMICKSEVKSFKDLSRCLVMEQDFGKKQCFCMYSFYLDYCIDGSNQEENEDEKNEENKENEKRKLIKYKENGCKEIINVDQLDTHIQNCKFKFVKCLHIGCEIV